jgi:hypothetical protein
VTHAQEAELRRALGLGSLHDINLAIGLLRDLEAVEAVPLPFALMRYVLQEIDHRFEGQAVTLETWRRVADLSPAFGTVLDSLRNGDRNASFAAMDTLTSSWRRLLASIG